MNAHLLNVFAVNGPVEGRHTFLSRSNDEAASLPNLAGWLGLRQGGLNLDEIELFPVSDLAEMQLSDYVTTAFDLEIAPDQQTALRMNALEGHVLLIPDLAIAGSVATGSELTLVATLPMAQADHMAEPLETEASTYGKPSPDNIGWHSEKSKNSSIMAVAVMAFVILISVILVLAT